MIPEEKELKELYKKAPPKVKEYITSPELSVAFEEMRLEHNLHLDEAGALSRALNSVFLGVRDFSDLPEMVKEAIQEHREAHNRILKSINEKVFTVFRDKLKEKPAEQSLEVEVNAPSTSSNIINLEKKITPDSEQTKVLDKLDASVRETPKEVLVEEKTTPEPEEPKTDQYKTSDPYREPIE